MCFSSPYQVCLPTVRNILIGVPGHTEAKRHRSLSNASYHQDIGDLDGKGAAMEESVARP
jgi:hypothetical protein